jgi:hypothetical protein
MEGTFKKSGILSRTTLHFHTHTHTNDFTNYEDDYEENYGAYRRATLLYARTRFVSRQGSCRAYFKGLKHKRACSKHNCLCLPVAACPIELEVAAISQ